jgi:hypothetical protein
VTAAAVTRLRRARRPDPIHALPALLLAAGVALRVLVVLGFRQAFLFYGDSYTYYDSAHHLRPPFVRPIGYPLMIRPLLLFHDLEAIAVAQHVAGILIAVLLYLTMRRLGLGVGLASLAMAPILLDPYQIDIEQYVLAETALELVLVLAMMALVWRARPTAGLCAAAGALIAVATLTRTVAIVAIVPVLLYLVLRRVGWRRLALTAAAFAVPMAGYAAWFDHQWGSFDVSGLSGWFLYARVAQFADCSKLSVSLSQLPLCQTTPPAQRPGPNFYMWAGASPAHRLQRSLYDQSGGTDSGPPLRSQVNSILQSFADEVIANQPADYARVVLGDLWQYAKPGHPRFPRGETVRMWQFGWQLRPFPRGRVGKQMYRVGGVPRPVRPEADWLASYQRHVYTPGPAYALALLLGLLGAAVGAARAGARSLRPEALLFALTGFSLVLMAAATSMFDYRYLLPTLALLPAAGALGLHTLHARLSPLRGLVRRRQASSPSTEPA